MNLVDQKFSQYLNNLDDQAVAGMLREVIFSLPEDQRRELIIKHCPEFKIDQNTCSNCNFDMGQNYENCGAAEDGVCPECGQDDEEEDYEVKICRTGYGFTSIVVSARNEQEAINKALDEAGDHDYSEKSSEFTEDGVKKL